MIYLSKQELEKISIILQDSQYNGKEITEDLIKEILSKLNDTYRKVVIVVHKSNKPQGLGTYGPIQ